MAEKKVKEPTKEEIEAKQTKLAKDIRKTDITELAHKLSDCVNADTGLCGDPRFIEIIGSK